MSAPLVSVVIPSHDSAGWAEGAVASVAAQTWPAWEVLLVDDGSRPADARRLEMIARRPGVRVLRQPASGAGRARRRGWESARGAFVAFLDDDDRYRPRYLERALAPLLRDSDLDAVHTRYATRDPAGGLRALRPVEGHEGRIFAREVRKGSVKTSTLMVRRPALCALEGLHEHLRTSEDYDMVLRLARSHCFAFVPEPLVDVTLRPGSLSTDLRGRHRNRIGIFESLLDEDRRRRELDRRERRALRRKLARTMLKEAEEALEGTTATGRRAPLAAAWNSLRTHPTPRAFALAWRAVRSA